jgi:uncharacterized protein DUF3105
MAAAVLLAGACSSSVTGQANSSANPPSSDAPATTERSDEPTDTSAGNDPSTRIDGIEIKPYKGGDHVQSPERVAYDQSPPFGGAHDAVWAACNGVVYTKAVRTEHMVHALEHGAVWIAYNPDTLPAAGVETLAKKVTDIPYMVMSPYPGLDKPVSLQSWGHRLKLDDPADPRVDQFIKALKQNKFTYPEPGATCDIPTGAFDQDNPPPFDPSPAPAGSRPAGS